VLPELNRDPHKLEEICAGLDLQLRGSSGEHSAAVGAKWDISNKQRISFSEVELVQKVIDGVSKIIAMEEELASANRATPPRPARAPAAPASAVVSQFRLPEIDPSFDKWLQGQLDASPADPKDTDDFRYITFTELPPFTNKHKSLMRKTLTPKLFAKLKDVKSSKGYSLSNAIQAGVLRPHLAVGITCGDEECFTLFKDIIYPAVEGLHKFDPTTQEHKSDLDPTKLFFTAEQAAKFATYIKSTRIRAARNIAGYSLPAGASKEDRLAVEGVLKEAFPSLPGALQGTYFPLGGLTCAHEDELQVRKD
jgi:creatine kinase